VSRILTLAPASSDATFRRNALFLARWPSYALGCIPANPKEPALAELVRHIIACGDERPIGFWVAAIEECVELDSDRCYLQDWDD
jgi:hypothetical protein